MRIHLKPSLTGRVRLSHSENGLVLQVETNGQAGVHWRNAQIEDLADLGNITTDLQEEKEQNRYRCCVATE